MKKIRIIQFIALVIFSLTIQGIKAYAGTVEVSLTKNKIPLSSGNITAENFQIAYEKIKSGDFSSDEYNSDEWKSLSVSQTWNDDHWDLNQKNHIIAVTRTEKFGLGVKNSDYNALKILNILPTTFLEVINKNTKTVGSQVSFQPTNIQGNTQGKLINGWTGFFLADKLIKYVNITSKTQKINLDTVNSSDAVSSSISNLNTGTKNGAFYGVEYDQKVTYNVTIKGDFLRHEGATLQLLCPANLVIDDVSIPYQTVDQFAFPLNLNDNSQFFMTQNQKGLSAKNMIYSAQSTIHARRIDVKIPAQSTDLTFTITAHIAASVVNTQQAVIGGGDNPIVVDAQSIKKAGDSPNDTYTVTDTQKSLDVYRPGYLFQDTEYSINILGFNADNESFNYFSDSVHVSGINFAQILKNGKSTKGGQYVLGKVVKGENYIWTGTGNWVKVGQALDKQDFSSVHNRILSGGNGYVFGDLKEIKLSDNTFFLNGLNTDKERSELESIITINGLSIGSEYFLYPIKLADGNNGIKKKINFKVSADVKVKENGSFVILTSMNIAPNTPSQIEKALPAYSAGNIEYHLIEVNGKIDSLKTTFSWVGIIPAIITFLVIMGITLLVIIKIVRN
ncbi:MAG: hypothetical protein LBI13_02360 [Streptococcaceae bacterium]|nr:hypothetical protein [Streptococcaceae bacterium]